MRFMVIVKSSPESEAGGFGDPEDFAAMGNFNEELVKAGVMLAGEGLYPSVKGARVRFDDKGATTVIDGPFTETKELIAGYWIWELPSIEDAVRVAEEGAVQGRRGGDPAGPRHRGVRRDHDARDQGAGGAAARAARRTRRSVRAGQRYVRA